MSDDTLTINAATLCLVQEILTEERGASVSMEDATAAVKLALPFLTGKKRREGGAKCPPA